MVTSRLHERTVYALNNSREAVNVPLSDRDVVYDDHTGEVRLRDPVGKGQMLFRLTKHGIVVWCKRSKQEYTISWKTLLRWVANAM